MADKKTMAEFVPYEVNGSRKYFILAGKRFELQTKGDGSTARIAFGDERYPVDTLVSGDIMHHVAQLMHNAIEAHVKDRLAKLEAAITKMIDIRQKDTMFFLQCAANCRHTTESEETEILALMGKIKKNRKRYESPIKQALQPKGEVNS